MKFIRIVPVFLSIGCLMMSSCGKQKGDMEKIYDFYNELNEHPVILDDFTTLEISDLDYGHLGYHISSKITVKRENYEIEVKPYDTYPYPYTNVIDFTLTMDFSSCAKPVEEGYNKQMGQDIVNLVLDAKYGDGTKTASEVENNELLKNNLFTTDKDCNFILLSSELSDLDVPITRTLLKTEGIRTLKLYKEWLQSNNLSLGAVNGLANL